MVQFGQAPGGGEDVAASERWAGSDLRSEIRAPYLWVTVRSMAPRNGRTALALHLEGGGGLKPPRVSKSDLERAVGDIFLRSKEGNSVRTFHSRPSGDLVVPPPDPQDYVAVATQGLDITVMGFRETLDYCQAIGSADRTFSVPEGSTLRYYLCSEVNCRMQDMGKAFYVPLMGVGLVEYGGKRE
jgi:hypothetical protein